MLYGCTEKTYNSRYGAGVFAFFAGVMLSGKEFTEDDIYIGFVAGEGKTTRALVPAETAQVFEGQMITGSIMYVLPAATSEKGVEVQCLRW